MKTGDNFGYSVSVSGAYVAVGARYDDSSRGSTYVFLRSETEWNEQQKITVSDGASSDYFGSSVSISEDGHALVGATDDDDDGYDSGSAYVFALGYLCTSSSTSSCTSSSASCVNRAADYPKTATEWDYLSVPPVVSGVTQVNAGSWSDINQVCVDRGLQLCQSDQFCTDRVPPAGIDISQHDSWIAVGDSENEWLTFRRGWGDRICKTHTQIAGSKPDWGNSSSTYTSGDMYRAGICCGNCSS